MLDFLWDHHQQRRIGDVEGKADEASRKATDFQERVRQLEDVI